MMELLKINFPTYKINDASNASIVGLLKIAEICKVRYDIMVFIERNEKNNDYFKFAEKNERIKNNVIDNEDITIIIMNMDNFVYFRKSYNIDIDIIRHIQKNLIIDAYCPICYSEKTFENPHFNCMTCNSSYCYDCIYKSFKIDNKCPYCKADLKKQIKSDII
jgi:hypothetical protein